MPATWRHRDRDPYLAAPTPRRSSARSTSSWRSRRDPPQVRPDLLLVLVEALRATNPHYLGAGASAERPLVDRLRVN